MRRQQQHRAVAAGLVENLGVVQPHAPPHILRAERREFDGLGGDIGQLAVETRRQLPYPRRRNIGKRAPQIVAHNGAAVAEHNAQQPEKHPAQHIKNAQRQTGKKAVKHRSVRGAAQCGQCGKRRNRQYNVLRRIMRAAESCAPPKTTRRRTRG